MCRIFGQFGPIPVNEKALQAASFSMRHGGPDRQSFQAGQGWALANNRLSIQGIDGGNQPFNNANGICVVFNGEIYNHNELRAKLRQQGLSFSDSCDGNVIAPLFHIYGPDFIKQLDGMFAIALVDFRKHPVLHLFTDPAGIKSAYIRWNNQNQTLGFSSEIEGLARLTGQRLAVEPDMVFDYLSLRAVCGETTIFKDIKTLGSSRHLRCEWGKKPEIFTYRSDISAPVPESSLFEAGLQFKNILDDEVAQIMAADVPVCVVTSGGLDSTLISALAARHANDLNSFHVCYKGDWPHDEREFAREAARQFGTRHHEIEVDPDNFPDLILQMTKHIGQPNTAPHSLSTYCLFSGIHDAGFRVAVTGEGSDEMFAGYERFMAALQTGDDWIPGYMDKFGPFSAGLRDKILSHDFLTATKSTTSRIDEFTNKVKATSPGAERLDALQALDQWERFPYYILRRVDHLSMAHAVEVRVPFCQPRVLDYSRQLPLDYRLSEGKSKRIVYEAAKDLIPSSILTRKKQPFTLPVTAMISRGTKLFDFMSGVFDDQDFRKRGYFEYKTMIRYLEQQADTPRDDVANMLWSAMAIELWHRNVERINRELESVPTAQPKLEINTNELT